MDRGLKKGTDKMKKLIRLADVMVFVCAVSCLASCGTTSEKLAIVKFQQSILGDSQKDLSVSIGLKKDSDMKVVLNSALATVDEDTRSGLMTEALSRSTSLIGAQTSGEIITSAPYDSTKKSLIIGMEANYAPFNWTESTPNSYTYPIDQTNEYADGYDVQLAKTLTTEMNYNLIIRKMTWDALIPAIESGDINAIVAGMTDTAEREQSIDFTAPYYTSELVLVVKASSSLASMTDLANLNGKKVVSQIQTVTDDVIDSVLVPNYGAIHETPLKTFSACALAVKTGTADAMTAEYPVAVSLVGGDN
jgi:ABC-type amino acid transport substrate-binding protein